MTHSTSNHYLTCDPADSSKACTNVGADVGPKTMAYQMDALNIQSCRHQLHY